MVIRVLDSSVNGEKEGKYVIGGWKPWPTGRFLAEGVGRNYEDECTIARVAVKEGRAWSRGSVVLRGRR